MRAQRAGGKRGAIGAQHFTLSNGFGGRVMRVKMFWDGRRLVHTRQVSTRMHHAGCGSINKARDLMLFARRQDVARCQHVGGKIAGVTAPMPGFRGDVNHAITALGGPCRDRRVG